jgi:hypothetical protein
MSWTIAQIEMKMEMENEVLALFFRSVTSEVPIENPN